jgi:hypothetical protein
MSEAPSEAEGERSPSADKRLRATFVLVLAVIVEVAWFKLKIVPEFRGMYAEYGDLAILPTATRLAFGWLPYLVAVVLAGLSLTLGLRGAEARSWQGTAAIVLAATTAVALGVVVVWSLYLPLQTLAGAVR